jgi:hypothetical protein
MKKMLAVLPCLMILAAFGVGTLLSRRDTILLSRGRVAARPG